MASCVPLAVRSRWPLAVLAATLALDVLRITVTPQYDAPAASLVAMYTLASCRRRSLAWPAGIASAALITAVYALAHAETWTSGAVLGLFDLPLLATAFGDTVRSRRTYLAEVEARAERAERTCEQEARRAVTEERLRITRELHDVVAHHITLVNAQAGVAHHLMRDNPDAAYLALGQIKETSRAALDELRATGTPVRVLLEYGTESLSVTVANDARFSPEPRIASGRETATKPASAGAEIGPGTGTGTGHGLIGMRERAAALGGTVAAGPDPGGGYRVRAELPLFPASSAAEKGN